MNALRSKVKRLEESLMPGKPLTPWKTVLLYDGLLENGEKVARVEDYTIYVNIISPAHERSIRVPAEVVKDRVN